MALLVFIVLGLWQNASDDEQYPEWDPGQQWSSPTVDVGDDIGFRMDEVVGSMVAGLDGVNRLPVLTVEKTTLVSLQSCSLVTRTVPLATESGRVSLEPFTGDRWTGEITVGDVNRRFAVAVGKDITVRRLDGSGSVRRLRGGPVSDLRMSSIGGTVAALAGPAMLAWPDDADKPERAEVGSEQLTDYAMSDDGSRLATVVHNTIWFWQVGEPIEAVPSGRDLPVDVPYAMSPGGNRFAVYDSANGEIDVWDVESRTLSMTVPAPPDAEPSVLAFDHLNRFIAVGSGSIVRIRPNRRLHRWSAPRSHGLLSGRQADSLGAPPMAPSAARSNPRW